MLRALARDPPPRGHRQPESGIPGFSRGEESTGVTELVAEALRVARTNPGQLRVIVTSQRGVPLETDHVVGLSDFDTRVLLGRASPKMLQRSLLNPRNDDLPRGWAAIETVSGTETVRLHGDAPLESSPVSRIDMGQVSVGLRRVAGLVRHGVAPRSAFETVAKSMTDAPRSVFEEIAGSRNSLEISMSAHPRFFEPWAIAMVAAGEKAGSLGSVLDELAELVSLT